MILKILSIITVTKVPTTNKDVIILVVDKNLTKNTLKILYQMQIKDKIGVWAWDNFKDAVILIII